MDELSLNAMPADEEWTEVYTGDGRCYLLNAVSGEKRWVGQEQNNMFTETESVTVPADWEERFSEDLPQVQHTVSASLTPKDTATLHTSSQNTVVETSESAAPQVLPKTNILRESSDQKQNRGLASAVRGGRKGLRRIRTSDRSLGRRRTSRSIADDSQSVVSRGSSVASTRSLRVVSTAHYLDCSLDDENQQDTEAVATGTSLPCAMETVTLPPTDVIEVQHDGNCESTYHETVDNNGCVTESSALQERIRDELQFNRQNITGTFCPEVGDAIITESRLHPEAQCDTPIESVNVVDASNVASTSEEATNAAAVTHGQEAPIVEMTIERDDQPDKAETQTIEPPNVQDPPKLEIEAIAIGTLSSEGRECAEETNEVEQLNSIPRTPALNEHAITPKSEHHHKSKATRRGKRGSSKRKKKTNVVQVTPEVIVDEPSDLQSLILGTSRTPFKWPKLSDLNEPVSRASNVLSAIWKKFWTTIRSGSFYSMIRIVFEIILLALAVSALAPSSMAPVVHADTFFRTVVAGERVSIAVIAEGIPAPSIQWKLNGVDIPGENSPTLLIEEATKSHSGTYTCVVHNIAGQTVWEEAFLNVVDDLYQGPSSIMETTENYASTILTMDDNGQGNSNDKDNKAQRASYWRDLVESMATPKRSWDDPRTLRARNCLLEKAPHAVRDSAMKDGGASVVAAGEHAGYLSCFYGVARATAEPELHELMVRLLERLRSLHGLSYHPHRLVNVVAKLDEISSALFDDDKHTRVPQPHHLFRIATALAYEGGLYSSGIPENVSRARLLPESITSLIIKGASLPTNSYNAEEL